MTQDFSWAKSAGKYLELYKKLMAGSTVPAASGAYPIRTFVPGKTVHEEQAEIRNSER
jgi:hypothetical protein